MLKIKDDVDLSVLEKFGFEYDGEFLDMFCYVQHSNFNGLEHTHYILSIDNETREIFFQKTAIAEEYINVLFDLIQANLVEEVE